MIEMMTSRPERHPFTEKIDVLELVINLIKEHEDKADKILTELERYAKVIEVLNET